MLPMYDFLWNPWAWFWPFPSLSKWRWYHLWQTLITSTRVSWFWQLNARCLGWCAWLNLLSLANRFGYPQSCTNTCLVRCVCRTRTGFGTKSACRWLIPVFRFLAGFKVLFHQDVNVHISSVDLPSYSDWTKRLAPQQFDFVFVNTLTRPERA